MARLGAGRNLKQMNVHVAIAQLGARSCVISVHLCERGGAGGEGNEHSPGVLRGHWSSLYTAASDELAVLAPDVNRSSISTIMIKCNRSLKGGNLCGLGP